MPDQPTSKLYTPREPPTRVTPCPFAYAELDVTTNYSFLRGASHPDEYVHEAADLGHKALAITDVNSLAGVVRAYEKARRIEGFQLIVGARLMFIDGTPDVLVWPPDREAYGRLCRLLTLGRRRAPKGECHLTLADFLAHAEGQLAAVCPAFDREIDEVPISMMRDVLGDDLSLALSLDHGPDDEAMRKAALARSWRLRVPLVATNQVHYHARFRRRLQDVLTCTRYGCTLADAGHRLFANDERHLKNPAEMHRLFAELPYAVSRGLAIAARCKFSLSELQYEYPIESVPAGVSATEQLRILTYVGADERYGKGLMPQSVAEQVEKELAFIKEWKNESYFLTVHDLVRYARGRGILCQGRGSAANSAVCYCLGVTAVDPAKFQLVFARFASSNRDEPPDIDIDFEHERREEVIQYVYEKYGRDRASMTASVITYRGRSAIRDVGKALGLGDDVVDAMADKLDWWHKGTLDDAHVREAGVDPTDERIGQLLWLVAELLGFPRHLSQHVGGMVIARGPLCDLVPIENASMAGRTVIEWDKNDLDVLRMFKVDCLALGMLTAISKSLAMIATHEKTYELHTIPEDDALVYDMATDADTIGVFQIESRAQMSMLPRLRPKEFYDLVVQVAIVRPGPIQGEMVHPYLRRRALRDADKHYEPPYENVKLREVLHKTLGVPLFQEQAMQMAIVAAGFTDAEADQLRRAMASWKRGEGLEKFEAKFVGGMLLNKYSRPFAERCFKQICGFGEYGFPESHAASFAKLVYASAWIKRHHPAAFCCGLLNSQPMGFYAPAQLVRDAHEHGVRVLPVDVNLSEWDCTLSSPLPSGEGLGERARADARDPHLASTTFGEHTSRCDGVAGPTREQPATSSQRDAQRSTRDFLHYQSKRHPLLSPLPEGEGVKSQKSTWGRDGPSVRLGFRMIKGLARDAADRIVAARRVGPFDSVDALQRRADLDAGTMRHLAGADAFGSLALNRRQATWQALAADNYDATLFDLAPRDDAVPPMLPGLAPARDVQADYATTGLSLKAHPVSFVRATLARERCVTAAMLGDPVACPHDRFVRVAGLVLVRQRPGTASGVVFMTLEDETGIANLIVWSDVYERDRKDARHATLLLAAGFVQREKNGVVHVIAQQLRDRSGLLPGLVQASRDFH